MNRIKPSEVINAYKHIPFQYGTGITILDDLCCPLAALVIYESDSGLNDILVNGLWDTATSTLGISRSYIGGFANAIDGEDKLTFIPRSITKEGYADYCLGYTDGAAVRLAMES